jgi:hypothetical protein
MGNTKLPVNGHTRGLNFQTEAYLSLSRLNHRLPGREAHPEVVQGTTDVHHQTADTLLPVGLKCSAGSPPVMCLRFVVGPVTLMLR